MINLTNHRQHRVITVLSGAGHWSWLIVSIPSSHVAPVTWHEARGTGPPTHAHFWHSKHESRTLYPTANIKVSQQYTIFNLFRPSQVDTSCRYPLHTILLLLTRQIFSMVGLCCGTNINVWQRLNVLAYYIKCISTVRQTDIRYPPSLSFMRLDKKNRELNKHLPFTIRMWYLLS